MNQLEFLLAQARKERDDADRIVKWLEHQIAQMDVGNPEIEREQSKPIRKRQSLGRRKSASVPVMAETVLRAFPLGLMTTQLLVELRKLGYESRSKNPANTLNSILRQAVPTFKRLADGRWILTAFVEHSKADISNGAKETSVH
jgi:hypothetical protein